MVKEKKKSKKKFTKKKIKIDKDENKKKKVPKFQCAECGQAFHQQGIFEDHKSIHTGTGLYIFLSKVHYFLSLPNANILPKLESFDLSEDTKIVYHNRTKTLY